MARLPDKIDPLALVRGYPSFTETKEYNYETEVRVHIARAREIRRILLKRQLQYAAMISASVAGVVVAGANLAIGEWMGVYLGLWLVLAAIGIWFWQRAEWGTDDLLLTTFRRDIEDPQRDSERRAEIDAVLAWYAQQQQPVAAGAPVVHIESVVRDPGRTTVRTVYNDELPGTVRQWRDLAEMVLRQHAPETFSLRTAERVGLTREQWNAARDIFIARGWAEWNHPDAPQQGVTLRLIGKRALREMITQLPMHEMATLEE